MLLSVLPSGIRNMGFLYQGWMILPVAFRTGDELDVHISGKSFTESLSPTG